MIDRKKQQIYEIGTDRQRNADIGKSISRPKAGAKKVVEPPQKKKQAPAESYYSPREYGAEAAAYETRVTEARVAMEERTAALQQSQKELELARADMERKRKRYYDLSEQLSGDGAAELLAGIEQEWTASVSAYGTAKGSYDNAYAQYVPYEDTYNRAVADYNGYLVKERSAYDAWRGTVRGAEEIRTEQGEIRGKRAELERLMRENNSLNDPGQINRAANAARIAANEARIRELQAYLGAQGDRESLLQEELGYSEYFRYEDLKQNGDFARLGRFDEGNTGATYRLVNAAAQGGPAEDARFSGSPMEHLRYMTEDEVAVYNYVYATEGQRGAEAYLEYLSPELNARVTGAEADAWRAWAGKNPLNAALASAGSAAMSPLSGIIGAVGHAATKWAGEELDPNARYNRLSNIKNAVREGVSAKVEENFGPVGSFLYGTGMSMADMLADAAVGSVTGGGNVAMALIGSRSFSEGVVDAKRRGLSDEEAMKLGVANAAAELITERIGLDEMLRLPKGMENAVFWKGAFKGAIGEAGEEGLTNILNFTADNLIAGEQSEFARAIETYKADGMSDKDALEAALKDAGISLALDTLGGALSGGAFGGYRGYTGKRAAEAKAADEKKAGAAEQRDGTESALNNGTTALNNGTTAPNNGTDVPSNGTDAPVAGGAGDSSAVETVSAQDVQEDVQKEAGRGRGTEPVKPGASLEELKQQAVNRRNPLISGTLPTARDEELLRQISDAGTKTEITAIDHGVSQEKTREALRIGEMIGRTIVFDPPGTSYNGFYHRPSGEIHISADTTDILAATVGHELTHSIEQTDGWKELKRLVAERMAETGTSWETAARERMETYAAAGHALEDRTQVDQEIVAHYVEKHLLTDEESIRQLVRKDRSVARIILDWLDGLWAKIAKTPKSQEREFIRRARETYRQAMAEEKAQHNRREAMAAARSAYADDEDAAGDAALETALGENSEGWLEPTDWSDFDASDYEFSRRENEKTARVGGEVKFSLRVFGDGRRFVDIQTDQDKFEGLDVAQKNKTAKTLIQKRFVGRVIGLENKAFVNGDTASEYVHPSKNIAPDIREAKMRAAPELDNLLDAGFNFRNAPDGADGHVHPNVTGGFDYFDVIFKVGDEYYQGVINIMNIKRGKLLKDVTKIRNITKDIISSYGENPKSEFLRDASMISIDGGTGNVNTKFSAREKDSEGRELTQKQQAYFAKSKVRDGNGNLKAVYHGSPSDFNEFSMKYLGLNGTSEGKGFYFTDDRNIAQSYANGTEAQRHQGADGRLYEVYLNIEKPLSSKRVSIPRAAFRKFIVAMSKQVDEDGEPLGFLDNYGDVAWEGLNNVVNSVMAVEYDGSDNDVNMIHSIINGCGERELVYEVLRKTTGYDGIIVEEATWGGDQTIYIAFHPDQIKNVDNEEPTDGKDIRYSIRERDSEGRELSAEQLRFFAKSKAVDAQGRLIPVYHGTKTPEFNEFRYDPEHQTGADYGEAYYFTSDLVKAQGYGYDPAKDPRIAAYKKGKQEMIDRLLKNPTEENKRAALDYRLDGKNIHDFMWDETYLTEGGGVKECYLNLVDPLISDAGGKFYFQVYPDLFKQARKNGNDGMIVKNVIDNPRGEHRPIDVYIAFSRNQMKNVDNRKPTNDPDIRYSVREEEGGFTKGWHDDDEAARTAQMEEDAKGRKEWAPVERAALSGKAAEHLGRVERKLTAHVAAAMDVPRQTSRDFLKPIVQELADEYLREGTVSPEVRDRLFNRAWDQGLVVDQEFYDTYKEVKGHLRTTAVTLSETDRDSRDWEEFRRRAFGTLRIVNEGGTPVDVLWQELQEMAPALFPDDILNPEDQLKHMYEVGQSIRKVEKTLDEHYGSDAAFAKQMTRNDFDAAVADCIRGLWEVRRYADEQRTEAAAVTDGEGEALTVEEVTKLYPKLKDARRALEKAMAKNLLNRRDRDLVQRLLRHDIQPEHLDPEVDNVRGILAVYEAKQAFEEIAKPIREWNRQRKARLYAEAEELVYEAEMAGGIKDKSKGFLYSRETMERNIRDIVKNPEHADRIINTYFRTVHQAEAAATRMKNAYRERVKALDISRKVRKGDQVSEAYAVQFYGEVSDILRMMEQSKFRLKQRDGKSYREWQAELQKLWEENPSLDKAKIENAAREMGKIYEELFAQMNEARVENGYEPINHRSGYFPHFQQDGRDGILSQFGKALGIDVEVQALPTSINGMTHTFKPGIRWFGNALERKTFDTAYDAMEGFDRYIEGCASVVHQTANIQRLRALANQIRYRTGDEGLREQIRKIQAREDLTDEQKDALIRETASEGKFQLSNFVVELDEYTNLLANKKSRADRNMEQAMGRDMYNIVKALESRVAANMVAINPGSWLTNFIPLTQGWAALDTRNLMMGMAQTLRAVRTDDGMVDRSDFLTNRVGSDMLVQTAAQEWSGKLSKLMEWIDGFTAGSLVRARYAQNVAQGMSEAEAMSEADEWTAGVMADRSKGAMPTVFHRSNPLTKVFTQFQLEVNNQLGYMFKDLPREKRKKGAMAVALALLKLALGAWLFNELYEKLLGRRPALDPVDMAFGFVKDWADPELDLADATVNLGGKIAENTPFIGGLLGGGRVPISSALPDVQNLVKVVGDSDWSAEKKLATAAKELGKPLIYMVLPFGGGQVKKIWEGLQMIRKGGSYTVDKDGNPLLQYPLYSTNDAVQKALEAGQAMIFGKTTIRSGREWVEGGFKNLSADQTATYQALVNLGVEQADAFELMQELRGAEKTGGQSRAQVQRDILRASGLEGDALGIVYYDLMVDDGSKEKTLMDSLREDGADMGAVANCLMDMKDAADSNTKRDIIRASGLTERQKQDIYRDRISDAYDERIEKFREAGMDMDDFLIAQNEYTRIKDSYEDEGDMATAFARWVNNSRYTATQKAVIRDSLKYWRQLPANADGYDRAIEAGLSDAEAAELVEAIGELEPPEGKTSVQEIQKYRVAIDQSVSESNQLKMLQSVGLKDSSYDKVAKGYEMGVAPAAWVRLKEVQQQFDANGNGSMTNAEWEAAIEGICSYGIVLPGDNTRFNLTNEQKGVLWQMMVGKNTKAKNNPFSPEAGQRWRELMGYE